MNIEKQNYFNNGKTWDQEVIANALQSKNRAWLLTFASLTIAILSLLSLLLLLPLKTFEPYVISVDRATGYYEVARGLMASDLTGDQAVTESNLVRYVTNREQYNPAILKDTYDKVVLMSDAAALKDFRELWSASNPDNPSIKLGPKTAISIKIKSVSFIAEKIASVRFIKETKSAQSSKISHWNAVIEFQYTQKPEKMIDRFENPLGFQVTNYRINPETLEITP